MNGRRSTRPRTRRPISGLLGAVIASGLLVACGGGDPGAVGTSSPAKRSQGTRTAAAAGVADPAATANALMDFAELRFAQYFPTHPPTLSLEPFLYRYYPTTQIYLGVAGGEVYVMAGTAGATPIHVGPVTDFITPGEPRPAITEQPAAARVAHGSPAEFAVVATGASLSYQWQLSADGGATFTDIAGANAASHRITATSLADSGTQFRVLVSGGDGAALTAAATLTVLAQGAVAALVDTGISGSQCFAARVTTLVACSSNEAVALNPAQDGMTGRDVTAPDAADGKLGFSYRRLPGGCVKDQLTGLTWEVKTALVGGPRDQYLMFTNHGDGRPGDASAYVAEVNAMGLCGYSDWRIPTVDELQSIVDYSGLTLDPAWFPNSPGGGYITSTPHATDPAADWRVSPDGSIRRSGRQNAWYVRLVR